jgi:hypothetical protein
LLSYGFDAVDINRRAAAYVDRILRGEKPGDLPVQLPTKFEMVLNVKTATALGLSNSRRASGRSWGLWRGIPVDSGESAYDLGGEIDMRPAGIVMRCGASL